mmetsp:Transcript_18810/g.65281  ORF Transcript_18810/g.65281 Transcript_18810/m.65281 type:complete len:213 (+) Transcript_18810:174-812(+)
MCGFSAVTSMRLDDMSAAMRVSLATTPTTQFFRKESHASARSRADSRNAAIMTGLKTFNSKWPVAPPKVTVVWLPKTRAATMLTASHCVGFTLPGMIDDPGSFAGSESSPKPQRGPEPRSRRSLAILFREQATVFSEPWASTTASWAASASNLFSAVSNDEPVSAAIKAATATSKPRVVFRPVPTAVPPSASFRSRGRAPRTRAAPRLTCAA